MSLEANPGVSTSPSGVIQSAYNFISEYDYAKFYKPELVMKMHPRYGNGLITGFCEITGANDTYEGDKIMHTEQGRLNQILEGVTVLDDVFTTAGGEKHNLRIGDTIVISDGTVERQADVMAVNSETEFVAANRDTGAFGFGGAVSLFAYTSDFPKGSEGFKQGRQWKPDMYENYTQIIKEYFDVAESDIAHPSWVQTPQGDRWYAYDMERTRILMQNKVEMTHIIGKRAAAGSAAAIAGKAGLNGIVPTVKTRGNVDNDYIKTLDQLDEITYRIKQQGAGTVYTVWCDMKQMTYFSNMLGGVNKHFDAGANYGVFKNNPKMALHLDFHSFVRNGITFHLTPWKLLDDPTYLGGSKFATTSVACMFVPTGDKQVSENGVTKARPYLSIRSRVGGGVNRKMKTKIFGLFGTETYEDKMAVEYISEQTNQMVGVNEWLIANRPAA